LLSAADALESRSAGSSRAASSGRTDIAIRRGIWKFAPVRKLARLGVERRGKKAGWPRADLLASDLLSRSIRCECQVVLCFSSGSLRGWAHPALLCSLCLRLSCTCLVGVGGLPEMPRARLTNFG
jgi:hypothetical protein